MTSLVHFKYLIIGFIIGVGCIAPGVSGGSLAIAFGIYDRLIGCAVHWKKKLLKEFGESMGDEVKDQPKSFFQKMKDAFD